LVGCGQVGAFTRPVELVDDGSGLWVLDVGLSNLVRTTSHGEMAGIVPIVRPDDSGTQYVPGRIQLGYGSSPILQWEVVTAPANAYPQALLTLPDGSSPGWLARITVGATLPAGFSSTRPFSHGVAACVSSGGLAVLIGRGTKRVDLLDTSSPNIKVDWELNLDPHEGTELNSVQTGCLSDLIIVRTRVLDSHQRAFLSGRDHFFTYQGEWKGSRSIGGTYSDRELGRLLDASGHYFATASNLRFEHPTVFLWKVQAREAPARGGIR
jgi:hypothetical protein